MGLQFRSCGDRLFAKGDGIAVVMIHDRQRRAAGWGQGEAGEGEGAGCYVMFVIRLFLRIAGIVNLYPIGIDGDGFRTPSGTDHHGQIRAVRCGVTRT